MTKNRHSPQVVVVGAGIVGASIAFQLTRRGAQVTVVDADEPGHGASFVSFAWMNARDKNPRHYQDLNRRSVDMWDRFARQLGQDIGLTWGGELRWAATPDGAETLVERVKTLQSWGYPIQILDEPQLKKLEQELAAGQVAAASYSMIDGHVDTKKVIRACLQRAAEKGARVCSQARVSDFQLAPSESGAKAVRAVQANGDLIPCDMVVLAGGPDIPELTAGVGIKFPLHHTFGATIITQPTAPLFHKAAVVHTAIDLKPQIAFRQFSDGSVMIHGGDGGTQDRSLGITDEEVEQVLEAATCFVPALSGVEIKEVRRGRRPLPEDGRSIVGFTQAVPNLYLAATHSGVTLAPLIGEFAAIEIIDGSTVDLLAPYRLERFYAASG